MRDGTLNSALVAAGLLSLGVLVAGCDNAPSGTHPQSPKSETSAKQVADLIRSAEGRNGQGPWVEQAQFELGERYYRGEGVPKDMAKAAAWWEPGYVRTLLHGEERPLEPIYFRISISELSGHQCF